MYSHPGHAQGIKNYITSIPDGSIVLMAVYDTAGPCGTPCQEALELVGGTGPAPAHRGKCLQCLFSSFHADSSDLQNG